MTFNRIPVITSAYLAIKKISKFVKEKSKKKVKGAAGFEWVLLSPLIIVMFLLILYFFLMSLSYIQYNNLANVMAQNLNVRRTGYNKGIDDTLTYSVSEGHLDEITIDNNGAVDDGNFENMTGNLDPNKNLSTTVKISTPGNSDDTLKRELNMIVRKESKRVAMMPGSSVNEVVSKVTKNGAVVQVNPNMGSNLAGSTIKVQINYKFLGLKMKAIGYNAIT